MDEMLFCRNAENGEMTLPLAIGRDENGRPLWLDLAAAPNILLAGCTKQGKVRGNECDDCFAHAA